MPARHQIRSAPRPQRAPDDLLVHLRRSRDHVDKHFAEPLDLAALAALAGLSRFHFLRQFRATYGLTPAAYLSRRRTESGGDRNAGEASDVALPLA